MCSIYGMLNYKYDPRPMLKLMGQDQLHRGPDGGGEFIDEKVAFGHRRLSIIDLSECGGQPMSNEDGSVVLIFNGEIYNFQELRAELKLRKHQFKSDSDTECIIHIYEEYGIPGLRRLDGMFAMAIYDKKLHKVFLIRDRMGKKPLVYFIKNHHLVFASEISVLKLHPDMPNELNTQGIGDFLSLQYIPAPQTIYQGVHKLEPGHYIEFDLNGAPAKIERYYQLDFSKKLNITFPEAALELKRLVFQAVNRRLTADVPLGVFLSGGVDSSIVASVMTELRAPEKTHSFNVGFNDPDYNESSYAETCAKFINRRFGNSLEFHQKTVNPGNFDLVRKMVKHYGEPYADASMLPTFLLCEFAKTQVTVALTGDGADESFAGYDRYLMMKYAQKLNIIPEFLRKIFFSEFAKLLPNGAERSQLTRIKRALKVAGAPQNRQYFTIIDRCIAPIKGALLKSDIVDTANYFRMLLTRSSSADELEKFCECDLLSYLHNDILTKIDIASMANSLELRSPFMDKEVMEFAARLPFDFKLNNVDKKYLLKYTFRDCFPPGFLERPKKGFAVPLASYLRNEWSNEVENLLFDTNLKINNLIDPKVSAKLWKRHKSNQADYSHLIWSLMILSLFLEE